MGSFFILHKATLFPEKPSIKKTAKIHVIKGIPDFTQQNTELPYGGNTYCAPVSASNYYMWLIKNDDHKIQLENIKKIAQDMHTDKNCSDPLEFIEGLKSFLKNKNIKINSISYTGWKPTTEKYTSSKIVTLNQIKEAICENNGVFANIGWYRKNANKYARYGGHWVNIVGYQEKSDNQSLYIQDPSIRTGKKPNKENVSLSKISSGKLVSGKGKDYKNLPTSAVGYYLLSGELKINTKVGDIAILDGIVVLDAEKLNR